MTLILVIVFNLVLFLIFQAQGIYGADSGDLVTAAFTFGVPHPPGYPLYSLLGFVISHAVKVYTVAWRIGLLSSVPQALAAGFVYLSVYKLTRNKLSAILAGILMPGIYIFFLYAVTCEVFGLHDLILAALIYWLVSYIQQPQHTLYLKATALTLGLGLSHHHLILLTIPSIITAGSILRKYLRKIHIKQCFILFAFFGIGLLPYLYLFIAAAAGKSPVIWEEANTLNGFLKLVLRARYGTFLAGPIMPSTVGDRLLHMKLYSQLLLTDFSAIGVLLALIGLWWLAVQKRLHFYFLSIGFLIYSFIYFFYAGYPIFGNFTLGIYERFLTSSYTYFVIFVGVGASAVLSGVRKIVQLYKLKSSGLLLSGFAALLVLYPVMLIYVTVNRFRDFAGDRSFELFARDIMQSATAGSTKPILLVTGDTPMFPVQYVRYVLGEYPDLPVIDIGMFEKPHYKKWIQLNFPELVNREEDLSTRQKFINANRQQRQIFNVFASPTDDENIWLPQGLVYKLYRPEDKISYQDLYEFNRNLWQNFRLRQIQNGVLGKYPHFVMMDILNYYTKSALETGVGLFKGGDNRGAREFFNKSIQIKGDSYIFEAYKYLGLLNLSEEKCRDAASAFTEGLRTTYVDDPEVYNYLALTYSKCLNVPDQAKKYQDLYEKTIGKTETPLEQIR